MSQEQKCKVNSTLRSGESISVEVFPRATLAYLQGQVSLHFDPEKKGLMSSRFYVSSC